MTPGYQGPIGDDDALPNRHDALSGDEFEAGIEWDDPEEDRRIRMDITNNLAAHPDVNLTDVHISVKGGFVSLTGKADNIDAKATIEAMVAKVDGVLDVVNFLQVRKGYDTGLRH